MISVKDIVGKEVVVKGDPIGKIKDVLIEIKNNELYFVVTNGGLLKKETFFIDANKTTIGEYVIANSKEDIIVDNPPEAPSASEIIGTIIIEETTGNEIGKVTDVLIDNNTLEVVFVGGEGNSKFIVPTGAIRGLGEYMIVDSIQPISEYK